MEIWETPDGTRPTPGRSFVMPDQIVPVQQFATELQGTGRFKPVPLIDEKTKKQAVDDNGELVFEQVEIMEKVRVSKGVKDIEMDIRHPPTWARKPDEWKTSIGLIKLVKGKPPANYSPILHTLEDGDTVDGVIQQVTVTRSVEDIKETLRQQVMAKVNAPEFQVVCQQAGIQDINKAIADYRAAKNVRGYVLLGEIAEAKTVRALADIKIEDGWPVTRSSGS